MAANKGLIAILRLALALAGATGLLTTLFVPEARGTAVRRRPKTREGNGP